MIRLSMAIAAIAMLSACGTSIPNDVSPSIGQQRQQEFQQRRSILRAAPSPEPVRLTRAEIPLAGSAPATVRAEPAMVSAAPGQSSGVARARPATTPARDPATGNPLSRMFSRVLGRDTERRPTRTATPARPAAPSAAPLPPMSQATSAPAAAPAGVSNPGISDEQEFDAVAARETIESDAERRAEMQAQRVEYTATAVPDRPSGLGPNIIDYALSTDHRVGQSRYRRNPLAQARHAQNCRSFRSPDLAQEWFLANGGPRRDRRALDPDGDGLACDWNPEVYRAAARAARD